jgi:hypothetical protein
MPTWGQGQMVGRTISLTPGHDKALEMLALKMGSRRVRGGGTTPTDWTPSRLVRWWIANAARYYGLDIELKEPEPAKPGPKPALGLRYRKARATRQLRLRLRKEAYKTRG